MTTLCFLWHMHQPFYKDLWTGRYKLPWTRLHALKDYAGMVRILGEFPKIRQTFNLVPSMLVQIEEYASGAASDPFLECALIAAEDLSEAQRSFALRYFFQASPRLIDRFPRYRELFENRANTSVQDLRDLQVLSQLAWFDEDVLASDPSVRELAAKGRDFSRADQDALIAKQRGCLQEVLPVYREFAQRGQIEISTTPFYHPILPLICDSGIARESDPKLTLPRPYLYPNDARVQLERAREFVRQRMGVEAAGLWPSEGSVSDEALTIAADAGFAWVASDNGVLGKTLGRDATNEDTYRPYAWRSNGRSLKLLFRDHYLSDLIGFDYSRVEAPAAADHFLERIRERAGKRDALVPVILDGENAWEYYESNGRPFLRELYRRIEDAPDLEAVTISDALRKFEAPLLDRVFPGSWINANFNIWIGAEEDNRAWELLLEARRAYDALRESVSEEAGELAFEELLIAEGSDWFWWYGPEHASDNRTEFDELFRDHLSNVYRALGLVPPAQLAVSLLTGQEGELHERPVNSIHVTIDGEVTTSFEWMGAGRYRPDNRSGAMHRAGPLVAELYYGRNETMLFVRVDGALGGAFRLEFDSGPAEVWEARGRIVEMSAPIRGSRFRVIATLDGIEQILPAQGWLEV